MACLNWKIGDGCMYEPWQRSYRASAGALPVSRDTAPRRLSVRALPSKPPGVGFSFSEYLACPPSTPLLAWSNSSESTSFPLPPLASYERPQVPSSRIHSMAVLGPSSDISVMQHTHDTADYVPRPTVSSFTVLPSIHFRTIPRPLQVPLSLIPPERVQISPIAGGDLDMTLCVLFRFPGFYRVAGTKL